MTFPICSRTLDIVFVHDSTRAFASSIICPSSPSSSISRIYFGKIALYQALHALRQLASLQGALGFGGIIAIHLVIGPAYSVKYWRLAAFLHITAAAVNFAAIPLYISTALQVARRGNKLPSAAPESRTQAYAISLTTASALAAISRATAVAAARSGT
ncbi:hypothetical protein D3C77_582620 [compost metagenome]